MELQLDSTSLESYRLFLKAKTLPSYSVRGRVLTVPDEYASELTNAKAVKADEPSGEMNPLLYDYQRDITAMALRKRKFAAFLDCGLGKTLIELEFAKHAAAQAGGCALIVTPLMVVPQFMEEAERFYPDLGVEHIPSANAAEWLRSGTSSIGVTNWEAMRNELSRGRLSALILDESSMLKSHYGKYGQASIALGRGLDWKLAATGTPAPNDRIEYANHAVFLDQFPNVNSFLARYFINRGQTSERWELRPHALKPFYRALSHWCIFVSDPSICGWKDNAGTLPPIHVSIESIDMTDEQTRAVQSETGALFATAPGGITTRSRLSRIAKGTGGIATNKPEYIRALVESFGDESTIVWCLYNDEQAGLAKLLPDAANISGDTPYDERITLLRQFRRGEKRVLISKPKILGFGLNLQVCTRMVFSGLQDSYESYYQAVKRANRTGSTKPLHVHIPVTEIEVPMIETVLVKAKRVQADTEEQQRIFKSCS